jgi:IS5 family transposase
MARIIERIRAAGGATHTRARVPRRSTGLRARSIASKLRLRAEAGKDEAQAAVRRITGDLTGVAERAMRDAKVLRRKRQTGAAPSRRATQRPTASGDQRLADDREQG